MRSKLGAVKSSTLTAIGAVLVFAIVFGLMLWLTAPKHNSNRENGLYQFIFLAIGVAASFLAGRQSARVSAADVLRPHAKAAVRRLTNLASGIQGFGVGLNTERQYIEQQAADNGGMVPLAAVTQAHEMLFIQIELQIQTATDAMEDWREFVPEEVATVERGGATDG
jgi:hypothetical protein